MITLRCHLLPLPHPISLGSVMIYLGSGGLRLSAAQPHHHASLTSPHSLTRSVCHAANSSLGCGGMGTLPDAFALWGS